MNIFRRQQLRGLTVTLLTAALLIGAIGFTVIGYASSEGARQQIDAIENRYMTIGTVGEQESQPIINPGWYITPDNPANHGNNWRTKNYTVLDDGTIQWADGTEYYSSLRLEQLAMQSPQICGVNRSSILSAHVKGVYGIPSGMQNEGSYNSAFDDHGVNFCVVVVRMVRNDLPDYDPTQPYVYMVRDESGPKAFQHVLGGMKFVSVVSAHPHFEPILSRYSVRNVSFAMGHNYYMNIFDADSGKPSMEEGKLYIFRCFYSDVPVFHGVSSKIGEKTYDYVKFDNNKLLEQVGGDTVPTGVGTEHWRKTVSGAYHKCPEPS